jgi:hypothetical protein
VALLALGEHRRETVHLADILADIRDIFAAEADDKISSANLIEKLAGSMPGRQEAE